MEDKTRKLILSMDDNQHLQLAKAATEQVMTLGQEFRASRNRLAAIAGISPEAIERLTDMIATIDQTSQETAAAEYALMVRTSNTILH